MTMEKTITELKKELKSAAIGYGLCVPWQQMMDDATDKEMLARMYLKGIDFCLEHDYPSIGYMKANFKGICEPLGIFINDIISVENYPKVVAIGDCVGKLSFDRYALSQVFVKHGSILDIFAQDHVRVTVDCFDNSMVNIKALGHAVVTVYQYIGAKVNVECDGTARVKVIKRNKKTY